MGYAEESLAILRDCAHLLCEAISATGKCNDVTPIVGSVSECFSQNEDVLAEVGLLDEGIRPDGLHQLLLGDDFSAAPQKYQQRFKCPGRDGYGLALAQQKLLVRIDAKGPEFVKDSGLCSHVESRSPEISVCEIYHAD